MTQRGRLTEWNDDRGFGHITPLEGGPTAFAHISEFPRNLRRPMATDLLEYEITHDERGRNRAINIRFLSAAGARSSRPVPARPAPPPILAICVACGFLLGVYATAARGHLPWSVVMVYTFMSAVTFFTYAADKDAAQNGRWRTAEGTLILLGFLGGWPGAYLAQELFRHKTRKQPFRTIFWASVAINVGLLVWFVVTSPFSTIS